MNYFIFDTRTVQALTQQALNKAAELAKHLVFGKIKKQKNVFTKYLYSWAFIFQNLNDLL